MRAPIGWSVLEILFFDLVSKVSPFFPLDCLSLNDLMRRNFNAGFWLSRLFI